MNAVFFIVDDQLTHYNGMITRSARYKYKQRHLNATLNTEPKESVFNRCITSYFIRSIRPGFGNAKKVIKKFQCICISITKANLMH